MISNDIETCIIFRNQPYTEYSKLDFSVLRVEKCHLHSSANSAEIYQNISKVSIHHTFTLDNGK